VSQGPEKELIFVLGGARSGKSAWALHYAQRQYKSCLFVATAEVLDEEMAERVRLHRASRGPNWGLIEEPLDVPGVLETRCEGRDVVLVDCLTVWLSNVLLRNGGEGAPFYEERLLEAFTQRRQAIIAVANEVGSGVVPTYALGRQFRDLAGRLNQRVASLADKVILTVAGLPLCLKGILDEG